MILFRHVVLLICGGATAAYSLVSQQQPCQWNGHSRSGTCLAAAPLSDYGLLNGIDVTSAEYYTSSLKMDSDEDVAWLFQLGLLWDAASKDASERNVTTHEYVNDVLDAINEFQASDEVHDREDFYAFLDLIKRSNGSLRLVLGGKSVGKSLVLGDFKSKLEKSTEYFPLLVDGRDFSGDSLPAGIVRGLKPFFKRGIGQLSNTEEDAIEFLKTAYLALKSVSADTAQPFRELFESEDSKDSEKLYDQILIILDSISKSGKLTAPKALQFFVELAEIRRERPVLIVDEANEVLGLGRGPSSKSRTLDLIVKLTKQEKRLHVILASTEYAYPYLLEDNGLNLNDIGGVFFAGEIPPKSMWELLVTKKKGGEGDEYLIGMGENMARLLIASYGGHLLRMIKALLSLTLEKEDFFLGQNLNPIGSNITRVLKQFPRDGLRYLRKMAECGFALVSEPSEPVVEMIVRCNIGGIIDVHGTVVDVPDSVWTSSSGYGLVPISESARNLIAMRVLAL